MKKIFLSIVILLSLNSCTNKYYEIEENDEKAEVSNSSFAYSDSEVSYHKFGNFKLINTSMDKKIKYTLKLTTTNYKGSYIKLEDIESGLKISSLNDILNCSEENTEITTENKFVSLYPGEEKEIKEKYYVIDWNKYYRISDFSSNCENIKKEYLGGLSDILVLDFTNKNAKNDIYCELSYIEYKLEVVGHLVLNDD